MRVLCLFLVVLSWAAVAVAAPTKKEATAFVKEVETAVKANSRMLEGGPDAIRKHNKWYAALDKKRRAMFVDADACAFASDSARSLWFGQRQYFLTSDQLGHQLLENKLGDYLDNMKACKNSLLEIK